MTLTDDEYQLIGKAVADAIERLQHIEKFTPGTTFTSDLRIDQNWYRVTIEPRSKPDGS